MAKMVFATTDPDASPTSRPTSRPAWTDSSQTSRPAISKATRYSVSMEYFETRSMNVDAQTSVAKMVSATTDPDASPTSRPPSRPAWTGASQTSRPAISKATRYSVSMEYFETRSMNVDAQTSVAKMVSATTDPDASPTSRPTSRPAWTDASQTSRPAISKATRY